MLVLKGSSLSCMRGPYCVFSGINFHVQGGDGLLVTGCNGSGKTSLIRAIAGLIPFSRGVASLQGGKPGIPLCEHVHYVAHADALKQGLSVAANLSFWAHYLGGGDIEPALEAFGLNVLADLPVAYLSAGQKRKVALSRLRLVSRPVWLLDEPSVSLDAGTRAVLSGLIYTHLAQGGIVIAVSHVDLGVTFTHQLTLGEKMMERKRA
ncbi:MAG: heme ABC exporter ATP-binding protein CcmA [Alphaproteobacteria bacterium]|nr:heme ABC exporter ATP-binding protein CcmA [Alphaproteobacteria bacterium]